MAAIYDMKAAEPAFASRKAKRTLERYFLRAWPCDDLGKRTPLAPRDRADEPWPLGARRPRLELRHWHGDDPGRFRRFRKNLLDYDEHMRQRGRLRGLRRDPAAGGRNLEFYEKQNLPVPTLRVVREEDDGAVVSGMKMLATGAAFANEIWIGNLIRSRRTSSPSRSPAPSGRRAGRGALVAQAVSSATPRASSRARSPGASTRPTRWRCATASRCRGRGVRAQGRGAGARHLHQAPGHCYGNH